MYKIKYGYKISIYKRGASYMVTVHLVATGQACFYGVFNFTDALKEFAAR